MAFGLTAILLLAASAQIEPPVLVKFVEAQFPEAEKARGASAAVTLEIAIADSGSVVEVTVVESGGERFDQAAVEAARQFIFEPARADGKPIGVKIAYRYEFVWKQEYVRRTTADLEGRILDRKSKAPVPGIRVVLEDGRECISDASGTFRLAELSPGDHQLTLSGERLKAIATQEHFDAAKKLEATYEVDLADPAAADEDDEYSLDVRAPRITKQVISTEVAAAEGRKIPGAQGDVLKVVENLPGVGRSAVGSGQLVVWGAAPEDTRVYVDGLRIPSLYHHGGVRSVLHSDLVRSVELLPGGYGSAYGRGLGGIVAVELLPLDEAALHGSVAADVFDLSGAIRAPIGEHLHLAGAFRRSHLDELARLVTSRDLGEVVPVPKYWDAQARALYSFSEGESVELGGLVSSDRIDRAVAAADPAETKRDRRDVDFGRVYLRYQKKLADGAKVTLLPSFGVDRSDVRSEFGAVPTELEVSSLVYALRASYRSAPGKAIDLELGLDTEVVASKVRQSGSIAAPAREGDVRVFGQSPAEQIGADAWSALFVGVAPYAQADIALFDGTVHVTPGLRLEPYLIGGDRLTVPSGDNPSIGFAREETVLEPRLSVRWAPSPRLSFKAGFGIYHQAPAPADLSAQFGNPRLELSSARQYLAGATYSPFETMDLELTGFFSESTDLTTRSPAENPLSGQALLQLGRGRSYGAQILLRQREVGGFFGWLSYSLIRSERADAPDSDYRLFDYDQTHVLTTVAAWALGAGFEVGARFRFASGFPRTPVEGAFFDSRSDTYSPIFGARNTSRIPAFVQLDARIAKRFMVGSGDAEVFLEVENVTDHASAEEVVYSYDYSQKRFITGLPILPVLGARWSW